jgi:hypothetical protein
MAVDASLDAFRKLIGAKSTGDDDLLTWALEAATEAIRPIVYPDHWNRSNVQYAVLMQANRYYRRRLSATGVEGFSPEGFSVRVMSVDPDIKQLLGRSRNMLKAGVA